MHPELEKMFEEAAPAPSGGPDVGSIVAGGRRLRTWRRARSAAGLVAMVAVLAVSVPAVIDGLGSSGSRSEPVRPVAPGDDSEPFRESAPDDGPVYVDRIVGEEKYLIGKKEIVASGVVLGKPWSMVEYVTTEGRQKDEPALCVEFFLGRDGNLGGGGNCATPKYDDSLVTLTGQYWGDAPDLVAVAGSIAEPAVGAQVKLADGRSRPLEIIWSSKDETIGWYAFFPPPFEEGRVIAYDTSGEVVGSRPICFPIGNGAEIKAPPPPGQNTSCSQ